MIFWADILQGRNQGKILGESKPMGGRNLLPLELT